MQQQLDSADFAELEAFTTYFHPIGVEGDELRAALIGYHANQGFTNPSALAAFIRQYRNPFAEEETAREREQRIRENMAAFRDRQKARNTHGNHR